MGQKDFTKINPAEVEWPVLYRVVSACGNSHNPRSFAIDILDNVASLCPFDQALVYFLDANHKLLGYYLKGIDEKYNREYLEYYAESMGHYDEFARVRENPNQPTINVRDWKKEKPSAFLRDYIQMRGLRYSVGFALYDLNANIRTVVALDRLKECPFTNRELYGLQLFVNIINQMHKNFLLSGKRAAEYPAGCLAGGPSDRPGDRSGGSAGTGSVPVQYQQDTVHFPVYDIQAYRAYL